MKNGKTTTIKPAAKKAANKKKPTAKKPVVKIISETPWYKEVETTETTVVKKVKDVMEIPTGTYFTAEVDGILISGVVFHQKGVDEDDDDNVYFLNNVCGEDVPDDVPSLGYSHCIDYNDIYADNDKIDESTLRFPKPPASFEVPEIPEKIAGYYPVIMRGKVKFGCQFVTNDQIKKLYENLKD